MGAEGLTDAQRRTLNGVNFDATDFDAVFCSPAARCRETARCLGLPTPAEEPRLRERHFGIFEGLTAEECRRIYPDEFAAFLRLDADYVIPGGESRAQHLDRLVEWLQDVSVYRHVLAVTHGGTIDFLFRLGTYGVAHGGTTVYAGPNAAVSVFEVSWPVVAVLDHGVLLGG